MARSETLLRSTAATLTAPKPARLIAILEETHFHTASGRPVTRRTYLGEGAKTPKYDIAFREEIKRAALNLGADYRGSDLHDFLCGELMEGAKTSDPSRQVVYEWRR